MTVKQDNFVLERVKDPKASDTEIARRAGYSEMTAKKRAHSIKNNDKVLKRIQDLGITGLNTLEDVAKHGKVEIARVQAGKTLVETAYGRPKDNKQNIIGDVTINVLKLSDSLKSLN